MKKYLSLICCGCLLLALSGCSTTAEAHMMETETKDSLVLAVGSEPEGGFDPCTGWGRYGSPLMQSTLVELDGDLQAVMDLATNYTISEDGLQWTFDLREDAYFTDGELVEAEDVAFTFLEAKESGSIVDLTNLVSAEATSQFRVVFTLETPESAFLYTIAATGIVPEHAYDANYGENPVGSGPYTLLQWDKGQQIILEANANYYGNVPEIQRVTIVFMEEDAAFLAAQEGMLDVVSTTATLAEHEISGMELVAMESIDNRGITLPVVPNTGETTAEGYAIGNDVTSDLAIRQALSYGIDRNALVEGILEGYGREAYSECDGMPWSNPEAYVEYDVELAKSILAEGGWSDTDGNGILDKDGQEATFKLLYAAGDSVRQGLSLMVAQQSKELGIQIEVEGTSWDVIAKEMFANAVLMGWGAQTPLETYYLYHSSNMGVDYYNPEQYISESVDAYLEQALAATDAEEAMEYWKNVQWDGESGVSTQGECPWVWLVNVDHLYYVNENLDMGTQKIHPHGHAWPVVSDLKNWKWKDTEVE